MSWYVFGFEDSVTEVRTVIFVDIPTGDEHFLSTTKRINVKVMAFLFNVK